MVGSFPFSLSIVDKKDILIIVERDGITDTLGQFNIEQITEIVSTLKNYK